MLRKLLGDRFHLQAHVVQEIFPVCGLGVEKQSSALSTSDSGEENQGSIYVKESTGGQTMVQFANSTMPELCAILTNFIKDRQVIDQTGLNGRFDFSLTLPTAVLHSNQSGGADQTDTTGAFITAVHSGSLKLVPEKAPLDVLVIDRIERPSEN